jgi:hypothetical protein
MSSFKASQEDIIFLPVYRHAHVHIHKSMINLHLIGNKMAEQ